MSCQYEVGGELHDVSPTRARRFERRLDLPNTPVHWASKLCRREHAGNEQEFVRLDAGDVGVLPQRLAQRIDMSMRILHPRMLPSRSVSCAFRARRSVALYHGQQLRARDRLDVVSVGPGARQRESSGPLPPTWVTRMTGVGRVRASCAELLQHAKPPIPGIMRSSRIAS